MHVIRKYIYIYTHTHSSMEMFTFHTFVTFHHVYDVSMLLIDSYCCIWYMSFLLLESTLWRGCIWCCCFRVGWIYIVVAMDLIRVVAANWSYYVTTAICWWFDLLLLLWHWLCCCCCRGESMCFNYCCWWLLSCCLGSESLLLLLIGDV